MRRILPVPDDTPARATSPDISLQANEYAAAALNFIGDAVICVDFGSTVTYLNAAAENLTGWSREDASGQTLEDVLTLIDGTTGIAVANPTGVAIRLNQKVALTPNCVLVRRDGSHASIEDSTAPIRDCHGAITGAVVVLREVTVARAASLRMAFLAHHDGLTGLPNRTLLNDRLTEALALGHRYKRKLAVLFVDIDRFKHVNDSLGHPIGDLLLQGAAERLRDCVRASDTVSRQGGDEFVILMMEIGHAQDAAVGAEKILAALRVPYHIGVSDLHVTGSIGIATYPDDGMEAETLLRNADFAMYHAKETGRDSYQFYQSEMNVRAMQRRSLEDDLRHALERHEFALHYQPKMDLMTGSIIGVEAFIRWHQPARGLVPPAQFIPVAEESGLMVPIGRWVLREACLQACAWQDVGLPLARMAVNVSAAELHAKDFVVAVREVLAETRLEANRLEFELTESSLLQGSRSTASVLKSLKDMGVQLALDDFGTGYSSLSYLKRFPIDNLKIDRSFVDGMLTDSNNASIVSAVIGMGRSLGMRVVAEGVETREQLTSLLERDCPEGQGHYFSEPLAAPRFTQLLGAGAHDTNR